MNYIGVDGQVRNDSLMHWKYIKKIKAGSGWRYFYTPEEVRAYYKEEQGKANAQYEAKEAYSNKKLSEGLRKNANAANSQMRKIGKEHSRALRRWGEGRVDPRVARKEEKRIINIANKESKKIKRTRKIENASHTVEREVKPVVKTAQAVTSKPFSELKKDATPVISRGKSRVEKMLTPTSGGTQKSKTISQTIGKTKRNNKPTVTKTENGTLTSRTLKESVNGRTTVNRPYVPSEKEKQYMKKYKKKAKKDSSVGTHKQTTLKETIGAPKPRRGYR